MAPKKHDAKVVRSFSINPSLLAEVRSAAEESGISGGMSAIACDAISAWLARYRADPKKWVSDRRLPVASAPVNDDL